MTGAVRAAIYVRVSTEQQDLLGQERDLRAEAGRRGWEIVRVFAEKVSGSGRADRVQYEALLREARDPDRSWDHLLVWALDRFSRDETFTKATEAVLNLERLGIRFCSLKEPTLDTPENGTPNMGRDVLLAILPVVAAFESRRRSERTRLAMVEIAAGRRATRSGRPPGRQRRVFAPQAKAIKRLRDQGLAFRDVAQRVGLPIGTCRRVDSSLRRGATYPPPQGAFKTRSVQKGAEADGCR